MKQAILERFSGEFCTVDDIVRYVGTVQPTSSRKTVVWNINDLVKQGIVTRVGRGVYYFNEKKKFQTAVSSMAEQICAALTKQFKYLEITVTDTASLNGFMNLLPFSSVVTLEVKKTAASAVTSALRKSGFNAWAKQDLPQMERYDASAQSVVVRPELSVNPPLQKENNIRLANLEKILVDIVCDEDIFGQYQGEELLNIYRGMTEAYAVNYSQMLKYANARKKRAYVEELLLSTNEFKKVRDLL